jgi:flagellar protein FliO/FliZ
MIRLGALLAAFSAPVWAADDAANGANQVLEASDAISWALSFVLVLVSIFVCAWLLKKTRMTPFGRSQLKVVGHLQLGTRERVLVVEVGDQQYLLGATSTNINLIDKLDKPLSAPAKPISGSFAKQLNRVIKGHEQ